jgi:glyoxylase-like metal-dependent hydrolase (beta-lactamase superfamily II)
MKLYEGGGVTVWSITEREGPHRKAHETFGGIDKARAAAILSGFPQGSYAPATDKLFHTYQSFLVQRGGKNILIDACVGDNKARPPHFNYPKFDFPANMARAGVAFDQVDLVICTHIHVDHVGWNTSLKDGKWVPTFPNARYIFGAEEYAYWEKVVARGDDLACRVWTDSALPVVAAGRADLVPMDHRIDDGLWFRPAPGHTPGMFRVDLMAGGQKLIFATDIIHHPLQLHLPDQSTIFCADPRQAAETRRAFLEEVADTGTIIMPEHFSWPVAGRVEREGDAYRYVYLDGRRF